MTDVDSTSVTRYKSGIEERRAKCPHCPKQNYVTFKEDKILNQNTCKHFVEKKKYLFIFDKDGGK